MKAALLFLLMTYQSSLLFAGTITASQGEVLRLEVPAKFAKHDNVQVKAFGKTWPIYTHLNKRLAWVGIHLKTEPQVYPLTWISLSQKRRDSIVVRKGEFRISHIQVPEKLATFDEASLKRIREDQASIKKSYITPVDTKNSWPEMIQPVTGTISTPFAAQRYVNGNPKSPHSGIDIAAPDGTPVKAPLDGTVLLVSDMFLNGNLVAIGHGDGFTTVYAHLKKAMVKVGDKVKQGEVFAEVGSTGRSTGPHLHWGVHFSGAKINPISMLNPNTK